MEKLKGYEEMRKLMSEMDIDNDFRFTHGSVTIGNPVSMYVNNILQEGLIKTYPIETTIKYIKKYFKLDDRNIYPSETENDEEQITVLIPKVGNNKELMDKAMDFCGYYCGCIDEINHGTYQVLRLQYERKYEEEHTEEIIDDTEYFYHISPSVYEEKIRKNGLAPYHRNKRFNYPDRIYLVTDITMDDYYVDDDVLKDLAEMLYQVNSNNGKTDNEFYDIAAYTVYQIDSEKLPKNIKLYRDPNMENAVYTKDNIPPSCFVNIAHIDLNNDVIEWEN